MAGWVLGIDFGTCFTCAAVGRDGRVEAVQPPGGKGRMPSVALLGEDGGVVVGYRAMSMAVVFPERAVRIPKRALADGPVTLVAGQEVETAAIVGAVLQAAAEEAIRQAGGQEPDRVVLTCPALWGAEERQRLAEAGERAGLGSAASLAADLLTEPVAAARFYAAGADGLAAAPVPAGGRVAVFDFGGGTLDTVVLERTTDGFSVVGAAGGNPRLGGEDLDEALRAVVERKVADAGGGAAWDELWAGTATDTRRAQRQLLAAITEAKEDLSGGNSSGSADPFGSSGSFAYLYVPLPGADVQVTDQRITREELTEAVRPLVEQAVGELIRTIDAAQVSAADLAGIYLTGGSSRVPLVAELISQRLGRMPEQRDDPKTVVVRGALTTLQPPVPRPQDDHSRAGGGPVARHGGAWLAPAASVRGTTPAMFRGGPARLGSYSGLADIPAGWKPWRKEVAYGKVLSSPVVAYGRVYVASSDGYLHARKARNGKRVDDDGASWPAGIGGQWSGYVLSTPAVAGGVVYVGGSDGCLYAIDAMTGAELGRFQTGGEIRSSPAVANGLVYVGSADGYLCAVDALTGTQSWRYRTGDAIRSSPAIADGLVYVGSDDGRLHALSAADGTWRWEHGTGDPMWSSPAVSDGVVYYGSDDGGLRARYALTGEKLWKYKTGGRVRSSPAVADGVVYCGTDDDYDGYLLAVDAKTKELLWRAEINSDDVPSSPVIAPSPGRGSGLVYIGTDRGSLRAFNAAGQPTWTYPTEGDVYCSPAVANGLVYATDDEGYLYAVNARTGDGSQ